MAGLDPVTPDGGRGVIVYTSSVAAQDGQIGQAAYAASKGGVLGLTLPVARDLSGFGIRVMTILPGLFHTPMFESMPRIPKGAGSRRPVPLPPRSPGGIRHARQGDHRERHAQRRSIRLDGALRMQSRNRRGHGVPHDDLTRLPPPPCGRSSEARVGVWARPFGVEFPPVPTLPPGGGGSGRASGRGTLAPVAGYRPALRFQPMLAPHRPEFVARLQDIRLVEGAEADFDLVVGRETRRAACGTEAAPGILRLPSSGPGPRSDRVGRIDRESAERAAADFRQVRQWHRPTRFGSPRARKVSRPQAQPPVKIVSPSPSSALRPAGRELVHVLGQFDVAPGQSVRVMGRGSRRRCGRRSTIRDGGRVAPRRAPPGPSSRTPR